MKSLLLLFRVVIDELGDLCGIDTVRDYKTVADRVEHEGFSFLAITLPTLEDGLLKSLASGVSDSTSYPGFEMRGSLPVFLRGFFSQVFDAASGKLLDVPSTDAIYAIRQISLLFKKVEMECTPQRVHRAFRKYVECEQIVKETDRRAPFLDEAYTRLCGRVLNELFSRIEKTLVFGDFWPAHGKGATAERLSANQKYSQTLWTDRLDRVFPATEWLLPNFSFLPDAEIGYLEPGAEVPVRVITVPKTLKTPRIIAIEPSYVMYIQQGMMDLFVSEMSKVHYFRHSVNGRDQGVNQRMARVGSIDGSFATIDLSDASDRVSNQHVRHLLRNFPFLSEAVDACRSRKADVPGFGVKRLAKFASMGSALTFPMEAIVFLTVVLYGIQSVHSKPLSRRQLSTLLQGQVRVFGDDIIVPGHYAEAVTRALDLFGFKVNERKSFWTGRFRESCGKEYYLGDDVSVVKVKSVLPSSRLHADEIEHTVNTRNLFYKAGLWRTVRYLDNILEGLIPFPAVAETSQALGRFSFLGYDAELWDPNLQVPLVRAAVVRRRTPKDSLEGYGALVKYFLNTKDKPVLMEGHLQRAGRPNEARINIRKVRSY